MCVECYFYFSKISLYFYQLVFRICPPTRVLTCISMYKTSITTHFQALEDLQLNFQQCICCFQTVLDFQGGLRLEEEYFEPLWLDEKMQRDGLKSKRTRGEFHMQQNKGEMLEIENNFHPYTI